MGFSRQEYWNGLPFPSPGDLPNPGIEPGSPAFQEILYHLRHQSEQLLKNNAIFGLGDVQRETSWQQYQQSCNKVSCYGSRWSPPSDRLFTKRQSHVGITTSPLPTGYLTTTCPIVNTREGVCLTLKSLFHAKAPLPRSHWLRNPIPWLELTNLE